MQQSGTVDFELDTVSFDVMNGVALPAGIWSFTTVLIRFAMSFQLLRNGSIGTNQLITVVLLYVFFSSLILKINAMRRFSNKPFIMLETSNR
jgi:hypothetical protein